MANLVLQFNGENTYSDGTYLPSPEVGVLNNRIIAQSIPFNSGDLTANAVIDYTSDELPSDVNELQKLNSGFIVVCDADWVTVIRDRNVMRFVFDANHDTTERIATVIFKHNTEKEVYCEVTITQEGEEYELTVDPDSIVFGEDADSTIVNVTCTGGTGRYIIRKIKKYTIYSYGDGEDEKITKRVVFDNAISAAIDPEDLSHLIVGSNGSLILDDSYYEVTIEHKDMIGLTQTITVKFPPYHRIESIPTDSEGGGNGCPEESLISITITAPPHEDVVDPELIIDERDTDITIDSSDYCAEIEIATVPQESQIYFVYYGGFIADYVITDYIDENENITHGLKIKAKPNPYGFGRDCIGYVINAMYPQVRTQITIHQDGNT